MTTESKETVDNNHNDEPAWSKPFAWTSKRTLDPFQRLAIQQARGAQLGLNAEARVLVDLSKSYNQQWTVNDEMTQRALPYNITVKRFDGTTELVNIADPNVEIYPVYD